MIVMQSALGAAWTISRQRLAGTAIGAAMGGLLATYLGVPNIFVFGAGVFVMGVVCDWWALRETPIGMRGSRWRSSC